jgi:hypothetical protein
VRSEYLLWWTDGNNIPALVTTSPNGTPLADAGVIGEPNTGTLFGSGDLFDKLRSGLRVGGGTWFAFAQDWGGELDYLVLENRGTSFFATSTGDPILARPFVNVLTGAEDAQLIAFPALAEGTISIQSSSQFQSAEALLRKRLYEQPRAFLAGIGPALQRTDLIAGYRFALLDEDLLINEFLETAGPTTFDITDSFDTKNQFHGAEVGFTSSHQLDRWSLELLLKFGIGSTHSKVRLDGRTVTTAGGMSSTADGGLLVLSTNRGSYSRNDLSVIPELGFTIGYFLTPRMQLTLGYSFIYWSRVARPGDQVDRNLNPSYFPNNGPPTGAPQPEFPFAITDFWAQGLSAGLDCRF